MCTFIVFSIPFFLFFFRVQHSQSDMFEIFVRFSFDLASGPWGDASGCLSWAIVATGAWRLGAMSGRKMWDVEGYG